MNAIRKAKQYIWLSPDDCIAPHALDLTPGSRDDIKVEHLSKCFIEEGFGRTYPALIGYPLNGKVQLLSGTHRHEAASRTGINLPVCIVLRSIVEAAWGTDQWNKLIEDVPVASLENALVPENIPAAALGDRIDLNEIIK